MIVRYFHFLDLDGNGDGFIARYFGPDALSRAESDGDYPDMVGDHLDSMWIVPGTVALD